MWLRLKQTAPVSTVTKVVSQSTSSMLKHTTRATSFSPFSLKNKKKQRKNTGRSFSQPLQIGGFKKSINYPPPSPPAAVLDIESLPAELQPGICGGLWWRCCWGRPRGQGASGNLGMKMELGGGGGKNYGSGQRTSSPEEGRMGTEEWALEDVKHELCVSCYISSSRRKSVFNGVHKGRNSTSTGRNFSFFYAHYARAQWLALWPDNEKALVRILTVEFPFFSWRSRFLPKTYFIGWLVNLKWPYVCVCVWVCAESECAPCDRLANSLGRPMAAGTASSGPVTR